MSERRVTVVVTANMGQYRNALQQASRDTVALGSQGQRSGFQIRNAMQVAAGSVATVGIAKLVKDSVQLEAAYSKTMRQVAEQTKAPKQQLAELDDLAMKLGADTVFSAQESASAMLELAKGGLSPAQIEAGALRNSLTLAAAGSLDLDVAANSVVNTMGAFRLEAGETDQAVSALAGAANASSADVSDITQALAQAGTEAKSAGLTVQETTAFLAAFSNAGIQGSDAGTSLRTMLTRLVPQTKEQADAMAALNLSFTDSNGEFVSAVEIADRMQRSFAGMSAEERTAALTTIFGADARRAANVLIEEGADGLAGYIRQTSDLDAAQRLADASMSGTSGALENLSGQVETAKIEFGKGLAPAVVEVAERLSDLAANGDVEAWGRAAGEGVVDFLDEIGPLAGSLQELAGSTLPAVATAGGAVVDVLELGADVAKPFLDAFNALPESAQQALILAGGAQMLGRRLGVLPALSESAGGGLLAFGTNAEKSGDKAKSASSKYATLATNVKGAGLLLAAGIAIPEFGSQVGDILDSIGVLRDKSSDLVKTLSSDGTATADTLEIITERLSSGALGKHAEKAGINLDRLAKSLTASGKEGEYARETLDKLQQTFETGDFMDEFSSTASSMLPFLETDEQRAEQMSSALRDLMNEYDQASAKAVERAEQQRLSANAWLIEAAGLSEYKSELMGLPTEVITQILTPGALDSAANIEALVRKYELTPDLVQTIVDLSGADVSAAEMREILNLANRIDRAKPKADVKVVTEAAQIGLGNVIGLLDRVTDREATVTIRQNIERSYTTDPGPSSKNLLDMLTDPAGAWTGGRVPEGFARGGVVPGRAPANPMIDNVVARGPAGKTLLVRSGEWIINEKQSDANHEWLAAINAGLNLSDLLGDVPSFAEGGQVDAVSPLELTRMRIRIRDLERSLRAREKYGKGGKKTRRVLRGLDRVEARQELAETREEYSDTLRANAAARRRGMGPERYNRYRETQAQQREQLRDDRRNAAESFIGNASIGEFSTPAQVERSLERSISDMATLTTLLVALKKKGAAPWLLQQLQAAGPSRTAIRLARGYLADSGALARVNAQARVLTKTSELYGQVTADPRWTKSNAWSGGLSAAQMAALAKTVNVNVTTQDPSKQAREVRRIAEAELKSMADGANV